MRKWRGSTKYMDGVKEFMIFSAANSKTKGFIVCPCKKCCLGVTLWEDIVYDHLTSGAGILEGYTEWVMHGEQINHSVNKDPIFEGSTTSPTNRMPTHDKFSGMQAMLRDVFAMHNDQLHYGGFDVGVKAEVVEEDITYYDENASKFYALLEEDDRPLHVNTKHSKLGAIIHLYNLKCMGGWSNTHFSLLLEFINELLPTDAYLEDLGLGYEKILACRNDCMLFWKENEKLDKCTLCNVSRWKDNIIDEEDGSSPISKRKSFKVLRWFPLIPRLQRLFMSQHTATHMKWHAVKRTKDGVLRHPADGDTWKSFDAHYPNFAKDPRNVRLGLSSDGFNPFGNMSTAHSTWPVLLVPYNLPPWMCMKQPYFMLSLIIPGPSSLGMNIDVYLQPLIAELKQLWDVGVQTFDVSLKKKFMLRAALMWTINDLPAYRDLSGWSTKGKKACPCCMDLTCSMWLTYGRKECYMGHRRSLPEDHIWRKNKGAFDGTEEMGHPLGVPSGDEIMRQLQGFVERPRSEGEGWKKRSIFFTLPYWKDNELRHNLDVMHIEKNVLDNIIGMLLDIRGKTKDNHKARQDLRKLGLRSALHPFIADNNKTYLPAADFTMTKTEKYGFLKVISDVRVPDEYASNVSRCVKLKECSIGSMKSHDSHILMQRLMPIALRGSLPKKVVGPLIELCGFFREICSKTLRIEDLDRLES